MLVVVPFGVGYLDRDRAGGIGVVTETDIGGPRLRSNADLFTRGSTTPLSASTAAPWMSPSDGTRADGRRDPGRRVDGTAVRLEHPAPPTGSATGKQLGGRLVQPRHVDPELVALNHQELTGGGVAKQGRFEIGGVPR